MYVSNMMTANDNDSYGAENGQRNRDNPPRSMNMASPGHVGNLTVKVFCLRQIWITPNSTDGEAAMIVHKQFAKSAPLEFPKKSDLSTPILKGSDPKHSNLPPKMFPSGPLQLNATGPPILSGTEANITEIKHSNHEAKLNTTHENTTSDFFNTTLPLKPEVLKKDTEKTPSEQDDMLHSKYKGGEDVDELMKPKKKATEKSEMKPTISKDNPKSEVAVSPSMDNKGPKLMNTTKSKTRESMLESTSTIMAVSSSVLSNTKPKHHEVLQPARTVVSVLLTLAIVLSLGVIGLLIWKKIALRRSGRDVLINEEDFDEVSDMHTFDRAQIQIT